MTQSIRLFAKWRRIVILFSIIMGMVACRADLNSESLSAATPRSGESPTKVGDSSLKAGKITLC